MSDFASQLNGRGFAAIELGHVIDTPRFVADLDVGMQRWFDGNLNGALAITETPDMKDAQKAADWQSGREDWLKMIEADPTNRSSLRSLCNLATPSGQRNVFICSARRAAITKLASTARCANYLCDRVLYVKQGNTRNGQAHIPDAITNTGFGLTAHLITSAGVKAMAATSAAIQSAGINVRYSGVPHLIAKPPGGEALPAHSDGPRPAKLIEYFESFGDELRSITNVHAARKFGVQTLIHHSGGRTDGATYAIGGLTPHKYYICLVAIRDGTLELTITDLFGLPIKTPNPFPLLPYGPLDGTEVASFEEYSAMIEQHDAEQLQAAIDNWLTGGTGPSFLKWDSPKVLEALNKKLAEHGLSPIYKASIRPESDDENSFAASWIFGYPHGSNKNKQRRITNTAPFQFSDGPDDRNPRYRKRVRDMATIASPHTSHADKTAAEAAIAADRKPLCGGKTHWNPERAAKWIRIGAPFRAICATPADADDFEARW
jgi:hypothetical protein